MLLSRGAGDHCVLEHTPAVGGLHPLLKSGGVSCSRKGTVRGVVRVQSQGHCEGDREGAVAEASITDLHQVAH